MNIVFSTNEFFIYQDNRKKTIFTISSNSSNPPYVLTSLFKSITEIDLINNATIISQKGGDKSVVFKALSVETFEKFIEKQKNVSSTNNMTHKMLLNIIYSLSKQMSYLLNIESKCFYTLDISNILVIDEQKFLYLSCEHLKDVKGTKIHILNPISKTSGYLSPELQEAKSIPILVSYKTIFYSLGLFVLDNIKSNTLDELLHIKDTKIFYFLKRSLEQEPERRFLLYV